VPVRDIVVIGGSAGGIAALQDLLAELPGNLNAALFVVVHSSAEKPGFLSDVLGKAGSLPTSYAVHGERFRRGHIYVAPPDRHLLLRDGVMHVSRGPRENGFRPAVDPLFRTAAEQHGRRVIGIVLSGGLDDGTHGLQLIKRNGGVAIVQHVEDATIPNMPLSAIQNVEVDHIVPAAEMGPLITRLSSEQLAMNRRKAKPGKDDIAEHGSRQLQQDGTGPPTPFTCPECGGALWACRDGRMDLYHCHVGHAFSADSLGNGLDGRLETALWTAFRTLEESAAFHRQAAERARTARLAALAQAYDQRAREAAARAAVVQSVLTNTERGVIARARRPPNPSRRQGKRRRR
jgi:two-component system chemotaxis response regulator CheB